MPLRNYGVLRGRVVDHRLGTRANAHFQLHVVDASGADFRVAINVESALAPSELQFVVDAGFRHPILVDVAALASGWTELERRAGGVALDFIRANLFDRALLRTLPFEVPGPDNDLNETIALYVRRAIADPSASVFAFGERWPTEDVPDKIFGFVPGQGVHDIHMNQSNVGRFTSDDGVWQDGALMFHFPGAAEQWVAIFLKFQSQGWHTDDQTGHEIAGPDDPPDGRLRIVAALVNAVQTPEVEFVTLLNTTAAAVELAGWRVADRDKRTMELSGVVGAGETLRVRLIPPVTLPNRGGVISLLDASGLKVDGVAYTGAQAAEPGRTIAF